MFAVETEAVHSVNRKKLSGVPPTEDRVSIAFTFSETLTVWHYHAPEAVTSSAASAQYGIICGNNPVNFVDPLGLRWFGGGDDGWTVGREGTFVSDQEGGLGRVLEQYVPAMETMSKYHDALVGFLTDKGVPDWLANIPTMKACYDQAVLKETLDSLKNLFDKDKGSGCK